jgi:hypothetical protein
MCSTCTREELSQIRNDFEFTEERTVYILVAGDDTNLWFRGSLDTTFLESNPKAPSPTTSIWILDESLEMWSLDATSCDISVGLHQHAIFFDLLDKMQLTELTVILEKLMMNGQAKLSFRDDWNSVELYMALMVQTFSGEMFTSFKNTIDICMLLFGALQGYFSGIVEEQLSMETFIQHVGRHTGFTLEGRSYKGAEECKAIDFLKGWWVPTGGAYEFMPLPSRILTYGKTATNFVHTTPGKKNPERSARYAAYATAKCNAVVPRDYPILGPFLDMCDRVSIAWDWENPSGWAFSTGYSEVGQRPIFAAHPSQVKVNADVVLDMMRIRYGDGLAEKLASLKTFLDDITFDTYKGFTVVSGFPWLSELRDEDYGLPKLVPITDPSEMPPFLEWQAARANPFPDANLISACSSPAESDTDAHSSSSDSESEEHCGVLFHSSDEESCDFTN